MEFPVFIICRDRVSCLQSLLRWLEQAGQREIYLVDNASSYPPLLSFYQNCPHPVLRLPENLGPRVLWGTPIVERLAAQRFYLVSDPDIIPNAECPLDAIDHLFQLLQKYPQAERVGLGLCIDDIPDYYPHKDLVLAWERQFWQQPVEPSVYLAAVDTTFALHRPAARATTNLALRTGTPYVARHQPWYLDPRQLPEEEAYYRAHARSDVSNWNLAERPVWMEEMLLRLNASARPRVDPGK